MTSWSVVLDPEGVSTNRVALELNQRGDPNGAIAIDQQGVDWGDAAIQAYMADAVIGSTPIDYRIPNRNISIPLFLGSNSGNPAADQVNFDNARSALQRKVALLQREGGILLRRTDDYDMYADIMNATLTLPDHWGEAGFVEDQVRLALECLPDFYGDELMLGDHTETASAELLFTEAGGAIAGGHPGRVRVVIDNDQPGVDFHGLLWGFRSRYYDPAASAALVYEGEALTPLDIAASFTRSGASGGSTMRHGALPGTTWCPVLSTGSLTHVGTYRVWARCYSNAATPSIRFAWDVGDLTSPIINDPVQLPAAGNFFLVDLGVIRIDKAPAGTHRWQGVIQAYAFNQGDPFEVDRIWFQPLDDGAGRLNAVQRPSIVGINVTNTAQQGNDDASVGTLAWFNPGNVTIEDGNPAQITSAGGGTTHYLKVSTFGFNIPSAATIAGIVVNIKRLTDGANTFDNRVSLMKGGVIQTPNKADVTTPWPVNPYTTKSYGSSSDLWGGTYTPADVNTGFFGVFFSVNLGAAARTVAVDVVRITIFYTISGGFVNLADAVIYGSQTAQLRTDGIIRLDSSGTSYGPVSTVAGDLPRVPPAGLENRVLEVLLKPSRGDLQTEPDSGIDDLSARIFYRPCYLFRP